MDITSDVYEKLTKDFPQDAYVVDKSRGFQLIGMRSAFVIERLTEVFGLLGTGWRFARSSFDQHNKEITVEVIIQYKVGEGGTYPFDWDPGVASWMPRFDEDNKVWSEYVSAVGGNQVGTGGVPVSDAQKSAESAALSKAASRLGVGVKAYKGLLVVEGQGVVIKGEDTQEKQMGELMGGLVIALTHIVKSDPDAYDEMRKKNPAIEMYHSKFLVAGVAKKVKSANLEKFVTDNLSKILGVDDNSLAIEALGARQLLFISGMVDDISTKKISWKDALEVSGSWTGDESWTELVERRVNESTS